MSSGPTAKARRLLIGTHNPGKVGEIEELLRGLRWRVEGLPDDAPTYEETGSTFADNARGKALFYAELSGLPTLADDSGLVVDALGGEPGVESARWIDPDLDPPARNRALLERLAGVAREQRTARFVCHVALARHDRIVFETTGACEGRITAERRGEGGFGYDPVFFSPELGCTFAEATGAEKSAVSHRGRAVRAMAAFLADWQPR